MRKHGCRKTGAVEKIRKKVFLPLKLKISAEKTESRKQDQKNSASILKPFQSHSKGKTIHKHEIPLSVQILVAE